MKRIIWNIRGLGSRRKMPDIIILQETKTASIDKKLEASVWGSRFKEWVFAPAQGRSGGIVVIWNIKHILVVESLVGAFSVSIKIRASTSLEWWLLGVYGPCKNKETGFLGRISRPLWPLWSKMVCGRRFQYGEVQK
ncbi:hypothetical protein D8674_026624 [Pyrus ussuriensis x Pyrus communis]|uniref:Uncharacterized protein n=1 Tax=Pyrus ussuriensis x Pyrus communis TaxID=2448454 RepID=A0A5N5IEF8_9ROSA|nr:hypothetical protein D8674_038009 [Pyrus ussuriensis x Pyrus communis]KAB2636090.1 hypothetical protein D8674_026624 [Pyrus ussuriensis x Pyrus communis]